MDSNRPWKQTTGLQTSCCCSFKTQILRSGISSEGLTLNPHTAQAPLQSTPSSSAHAQWASWTHALQVLISVSMIRARLLSISSRVCPCWGPWTPRRRSGCPSPWWPSARSAGTCGRSRCTGRRSGPPSGTSRRTIGWSTRRTPASGRCRPLRRCSWSTEAPKRHDGGTKRAGSRTQLLQEASVPRHHAQSVAFLWERRSTLQRHDVWAIVRLRQRDHSGELCVLCWMRTEITHLFRPCCVKAYEPLYLTALLKVLFCFDRNCCLVSLKITHGETINLLLKRATFHIHKCKFTDRKPWLFFPFLKRSNITFYQFCGLRSERQLKVHQLVLYLKFLYSLSSPPALSACTRFPWSPLTVNTL